MQPTEVLARSELFAGSSAADFEPLVRSAVTRHYQRGERIFGAGDRADSMYLILEGEVIVSRIGPNGEEYVVEAFAAGDVLGPLHFFEPAPIRVLDARAVEPTSCWLVPRAVVFQLLEQSPKLMLAMLRTYSGWIVQRDLQDADASFRNVSAQVATKLLHLADRFGEPGDHGLRIQLRVTAMTLANMIGASRENVSRAIAQLKREGYVHREKGHFVLAQPDELRVRYSWVTEEEARTARTDRTRRPPPGSRSR